MVYDGLLMIALWMAATALLVVISGKEISPANWLFQAYLIVVAWAYLAVCWRAGHTLGMKAWRIRIVGPGDTVSWKATVIRFGMALVSWLGAGIGFFWSLFHPQRATWHDLASGTRLLVTPKASSKTAQQNDAQDKNQRTRQQHRKP